MVSNEFAHLSLLPVVSFDGLASSCTNAHMAVCDGDRSLQAVIPAGYGVPMNDMHQHGSLFDGRGPYNRSVLRHAA